MHFQGRLLPIQETLLRKWWGEGRPLRRGGWTLGSLVACGRTGSLAPSSPAARRGSPRGTVEAEPGAGGQAGRQAGQAGGQGLRAEHLGPPRALP